MVSMAFLTSFSQMSAGVTTSHAPPREPPLKDWHLDEPVGSASTHLGWLIST
jgi:hypothetical protein